MVLLLCVNKHRFSGSLMRVEFLIGAFVRLNYRCNLWMLNVNVCCGVKTKGSNVECFGPPAVGHRSEVAGGSRVALQYSRNEVGARGRHCGSNEALCPRPTTATCSLPRPRPRPRT